MDGYKILDKLKNNENYKVYNKDEEIFHIEKKYETKNIVKTKIRVYLKGTYGLEKGIEENLVFDKELFEKLDNFKVIKTEDYINLECAKSLDENQKKITELYKYVILERIK